MPQVLNQAVGNVDHRMNQTGDAASEFDTRLRPMMALDEDFPLRVPYALKGTGQCGEAQRGIADGAADHDDIPGAGSGTGCPDTIGDMAERGHADAQRARR